MANMFKHIMNVMLELVFPWSCIHCRRPLPVSSQALQLCPDCQTRLTANRPPFCRRCSRPLKASSLRVCPTCRKYRHHFDKAWGVLVYNTTMRRLLHLYKYGHKTGLTPFFTDRMENFIRQSRLPIFRADGIIPLPLAFARQRQRGYNQARLLANALSLRLQIPMLDCLERRRNTKNQARLSGKERWTNIKDAFKIKHRYSYKNKKFFLVDDLLTTGATVSEAAKVLKAAGASKVYVLTLAVAQSETHS